MRRRTFLFSALASGLAVISARAQTAWPVRTARFIVPFAAGSALDVPTRMIADRLVAELGATFVIENHSGAGGAIGVQLVVQAEPDGGTFLVTSSSVASLPALRPNLGFELPWPSFIVPPGRCTPSKSSARASAIVLSTVTFLPRTSCLKP